MDVTVEDKLNYIIESCQRAHTVEETFVGFLEPSFHQVGDQYGLKIKEILSSSTQPHHSLLKAFFNKMYFLEKNIARSQLILKLIEQEVESCSIPSKSVSEALLTCDQFHWCNQDKWVPAIALIRRIVGGIDYKGVRDILKYLLEKALQIPLKVDVNVKSALDAYVQLVTYILNRNACLLPSYFVLDEINKVLSHDKPRVHWKLKTLLTDVVASFRPTAQLVSVIGRDQLLPVVGHSNSGASNWKLQQNSLQFILIGPLPYDLNLYEPQGNLLRYVLEQPYSRDLVCSLLGLNKQNKQRCKMLEGQLVSLVVMAMERSENNIVDELSNDLMWQHLSSQLIFFVLFQFASFPHMVLSLYDKLASRNLQKGRDHLMWVLLQFISGSIQKNQLGDFLPVMRLYDLLYPEKEIRQVPNASLPSSTHQMAATCIWIHLNKKAMSDDVKLERPIPHSLKDHLDYLNSKQGTTSLSSDYSTVLLCNAYSTNNDIFFKPMTVLLESIYGQSSNANNPARISPPVISLPGNLQAFAPTVPLSMVMLDSLTVHAKMSLIHGIVTRVIKLAQSKTLTALAPALVETYGRLLVYIEIESLGIKGFISQLMPSVFKAQAWGILHSLLEMFSYRLHHIQPHYRIQLLQQLHTVAQKTSQTQLHLCVESTALRLIMGLGSAEVQPQISRVFSDPKQQKLLSQDSEELNRALVLTIARSMHITSSESFASAWYTDVLNAIMQSTAHTWNKKTLACFPQQLRDYFNSRKVSKEDKNQLKKLVDDEYRQWKGLLAESDMINRFSNPQSPPVFICVLWMSQLEEKRISPLAFSILERIGPHSLSAHIRKFADFLIYEISNAKSATNCIEALMDLIWKKNIIPFEKLVLCLCLRSFDDDHTRVCSIVLNNILLQPMHFKLRVEDFVNSTSAEHWLQSDWHDKHMAFHKKYPEKFAFLSTNEGAISNGFLPIYFGNVCLRFLPVFDILIHRYLEVTDSTMLHLLETILKDLGPLYKFHDRPITYLYNTLHYYENNLADKPHLRKKLVASIIGAFKYIKPTNWCLSEEYLKFLELSTYTWEPSCSYYCSLIERLVQTLTGTSPQPFPACDWRFNEFPSPAAHAIYSTCVELMALPVLGKDVGNAIINVILTQLIGIDREKHLCWINAVGLVLTALPDSYWCVIYSHIQNTLYLSMTSPLNPFQMCSFMESHNLMAENATSLILALSHAILQHANIGQISGMPGIIKEQIKPLVKTESQFIFVCHLVGPFMQRFHVERTRLLHELVIEIYEMLLQADQNTNQLQYLDAIVDFLYHLKYMFVGDAIKQEIEQIMAKFKRPLQLRLRFIVPNARLISN